jgi:hypothetical protein
MISAFLLVLKSTDGISSSLRLRPPLQKKSKSSSSTLPAYGGGPKGGGSDPPRTRRGYSKEKMAIAVRQPNQTQINSKALTNPGNRRVPATLNDPRATRLSNSDADSESARISRAAVKGE